MNKKFAMVIVIIAVVIYGGINLFQLIKADNSGRVTHLYNVVVADKYESKYAKSTRYMVVVNNNDVKNFSFAINKETWDNIHIGEKFDIDYDLGWSSVNRLWKK